MRSLALNLLSPDIGKRGGWVEALGGKGYAKMLNHTSVTGSIFIKGVALFSLQELADTTPKTWKLQVKYWT